MIEINTALFKSVPFNHQLVGVKEIVSNVNFALFDEMGAGKTKQVIDSACVLYDAGVIDTVVVVCPAQVKIVWMDEEIGEIVKHSWKSGRAFEYCTKFPTINFRPGELTWVVVSYEFLRQKDRLHKLMTMLKANRRKTFLVFDESISIKNPKAAQTVASSHLRTVCDRAILLNGTPISIGPLDLYAQFACLDKKILGFKNYWAFRNHHAKMGGYMGKQVIGYLNMEELQLKLKPYILRRLKSECLDLDEKLYSPIEVKLTPATWKIYLEMKKDMVAWLNQAEVSVASQAAIRSLRLAQITSGFIGGIIDNSENEELFDPTQGKLEYLPAKPISDEKLKVITDWVADRFEENPSFRVIIWCRFRPELERFQEVLIKRFPSVPVHILQGGQSKKERTATIHEFQDGDVSKPAIGVGQPQAGRFGLNFITCHTVVYASNDYSLLTRSQSEDRVHRSGQKNQVTYFDVLAVGPDGQKTVDHIIAKALLRKEDISKMTTEQWKSALLEE